MKGNSKVREGLGHKKHMYAELYGFCYLISLSFFSFSTRSASAAKLRRRKRGRKISNYKRICLEIHAYYVLMYTAN